MPSSKWSKSNYTYPLHSESNGVAVEHWGGDPAVIHPEVLGVELPTGTVEEWIKKQDWGEILNG